jgi:archaellum component FlaC
MKQSNTEKAVYAKLSTQKVELGQHEVELSNDLSVMLNVISGQLGIDERVIDVTQEILFSLEKNIPKGKERFKTNNSVIKGSKGKIEIVEEELKRVSKIAAELGVKPSAVNNFNKVSSELDKLKKSLRMIEENLNTRLGRILS